MVAQWVVPDFDNAAELDHDPEGWRSLAAAVQALGAPDWHRDALCREYPAEWWFPTVETNDIERARDVCERCMVAAECMTAALEDPNTAGVWAGTSVANRKALRALDVDAA